MTCAVIAAAFASPCLAPSAYADAGSASVWVWQKLSTDQESGVDKTFEYQLEALTDGAPMPEGSQGGVYSWTMTRDERRTLTIPLVEAPTDVYEYRMYQRVVEKKDGYTYDATVYRMRLHPSYDVSGNPTGVLFVYDEAGEVKEPDPGWTVMYVAPQPDPDPQPDPAPTDPVSKARQTAASLAKTVDALDVAVFAALAVGSIAVIVWSLRKRRRAKAEASEEGGRS